MARIRTVKPEFFCDPDLATCSIEARYLYMGLISYADDEGRLVGSVRAIAGDVFPHDTLISERRIKRWLGEIEAIGSVIRYEVAGAAYVWIPKFVLHQRIDKPQPSRLPAPPDEVVNSSALTRESFANSSGTIPALINDSGRDRGSRSLSGSEQESFDQFWQTYPRKAAKGAAAKAFANALRLADAETIIAGAKRYAEDPNRDPAYTAHASTWLRAQRWDDEPLPPRHDPQRRFAALLEEERL